MKRLLFSQILPLGTAFVLQPDPYNFLRCEVCYIGLSSINTFLLAPGGDGFWVDAVLAVCKETYADDECDKFGKKAINFFIKSFMAFHLQPPYFCEEWAKMCKTNYYTPLKIEDYTNRILSDKPKSIQDDNFT